MIKVFLNALADAYEVTGAKEMDIFKVRKRRKPDDIIDGSIRGQDRNADRSSGKFLTLCQPSHEMSTDKDNVRYECNRTYGCDAPMNFLVAHQRAYTRPRSRSSVLFREAG